MPHDLQLTSSVSFNGGLLCASKTYIFPDSARNSRLFSGVWSNSIYSITEACDGSNRIAVQGLSHGQHTGCTMQGGQVVGGFGRTDAHCLVVRYPLPHVAMLILRTYTLCTSSRIDNHSAWERQQAAASQLCRPYMLVHGSHASHSCPTSCRRHHLP